jgi:hypothetical protein
VDQSVPEAGGSVVALQDGIVILRYMFGFRGKSLVTNSLGPSASRTSPDDIAKYLTDASSTMLDVDGNGLIVGLQDGLLILRYLVGFRGPALVKGVLGLGATRTAPEAVTAFLDSRMPTSAGKSAGKAAATLEQPLVDGTFRSLGEAERTFHEIFLAQHQGTNKSSRLWYRDRHQPTR